LQTSLQRRAELAKRRGVAVGQPARLDGPARDLSLGRKAGGLPLLALRCGCLECLADRENHGVRGRRQLQNIEIHTLGDVQRLLEFCVLDGAHDLLGRGLAEVLEPAAFVRVTFGVEAVGEHATIQAKTVAGRCHQAMAGDGVGQVPVCI
jgi:hypothetical protein